MEGDVEHPASEFGKLDWSALPAEAFGTWWSTAKYDRGKRVVVVFPKDGSSLASENWEMPEALSRLIDVLCRHARNDVRRDINNALRREDE